MKKITFIILGIFLGLVAVYFFIFLFRPSAIFDFYIKPEGLEFSNKKEIFFKIKPFEIDVRLTHTQRHKSHLFWSPNKNYLAFFEDTGTGDWDRECVIKVINPRTLSIRTVFVGTYHTSTYKWLDDKTIRVFVSAGSGVGIYRDIDINIKEPFVAAEHENPEFWTPVLSSEY